MIRWRGKRTCIYSIVDVKMPAAAGVWLDDPQPRSHFLLGYVLYSFVCYETKQVPSFHVG